MANDVHSQITEEAELHVPKGFTEAANETAPVKNAAGGLEYRLLSELGEQGPQGEAGTGVQTVKTVDITDPSSEMAPLSGTADGDLLVTYVELGAGGHESTIYSWDDTIPQPTTNVPFVVGGDGGKWIATAGKFSNNEKRTAAGSTYLSRTVVADINDPIELNSLGGVTGDTMKVYTLNAGNNKGSMYLLDVDSIESESPPFTVDASGGGLWILEASTFSLAHNNIANGIFVERARGVIASNGTDTVTVSVDQLGGGDLTSIVAGIEQIVDCTPAQIVELTAGSDSAPTLNYVYFSGGVLTANTTGFPLAFHLKVATYLVQSPAGVATDEAYKEHMWVNNLVDVTGEGEIEHVTEWIRQQNATYSDGVALTPIVGASTFDIQTSSGNVYQFHKNDFPAQDTSVSDPIWVVNDPVTPYKRITDMTTMLTSSDSVSLSNGRFNVVIWGSVNQDNSKLYTNLPSGSPYNNDADAILDTNGTANFNVPTDFKGTGFLIARLTVRHVSAGNTWSILQNEDLRGQAPANAVGGTGAFTTEFSDNVFKIFNVADNTKIFEMDLSNITTGNTRTLSMADGDRDLENVLDTASYNAAKGIAKSALAALEIDMSADKLKTKTITGNSVFTIVNPVLGSVVQTTVTGDFTITLPATVENQTQVEALYEGTKNNLLSIECVDAVTPVYWASIMVGD